MSDQISFIEFVKKYGLVKPAPYQERIFTAFLEHPYRPILIDWVYRNYPPPASIIAVEKNYRNIDQIEVWMDEVGKLPKGVWEKMHLNEWPESEEQ